jgi:hypothetical protein
MLLLLLLPALGVAKYGEIPACAHDPTFPVCTQEGLISAEVLCSPAAVASGPAA